MVDRAHRRLHRHPAADVPLCRRARRGAARREGRDAPLRQLLLQEPTFGRQWLARPGEATARDRARERGARQPAHPGSRGRAFHRRPRVGTCLRAAGARPRTPYRSHRSRRRRAAVPRAHPDRPRRRARGPRALRRGDALRDRRTTRPVRVRQDLLQLHQCLRGARRAPARGRVDRRRLELGRVTPVQRVSGTVPRPPRRGAPVARRLDAGRGRSATRVLGIGRGQPLQHRARVPRGRRGASPARRPRRRRRRVPPGVGARARTPVGARACCASRRARSRWRRR